MEDRKQTAGEPVFICLPKVCEEDDGQPLVRQPRDEGFEALPSSTMEDYSVTMNYIRMPAETIMAPPAVIQSRRCPHLFQT